MNKLFTKIASLSVGLALAVGVGVAVSGQKASKVVRASQELEQTYDLSNSLPSSLTSSQSLTKDSNGRGMGKAGASYTLTTSDSFTNVNMIVVNAATNYGTYANHSISITVGGNAFSSAKNFSAKASTDYTFETSTSLSGVVVVSLNNSAAGTTKSNTIWVKTIEIYVEGSSEGPFTVTYDGNGATSGSMTDSNEYDSGDTVTIMACGFMRTDYEVTGWNTKADGSGTSYVLSGTFTITGNVTLYAQWEYVGKGSPTNPYTVAEAIAAIDAAGSSTITDRCVKGIICQIDSYNSTYHSITYWISDDGSTTTKLEVYSGKGLNGADFSKKEDLTLKYNVVVNGNLKKYNTTYEFDVSSKLLSYTEPQIVSVDSVASSPESIYVGQTLLLTDVVLNITYQGGAHDTINPTSIELDTSVAGEGVEGTAYYEEVGSATFTINVLEKDFSGTHVLSSTATEYISTLTNDLFHANVDDSEAFTLVDSNNFRLYGSPNTADFMMYGSASIKLAAPAGYYISTVVVNAYAGDSKAATLTIGGIAHSVSSEATYVDYSSYVLGSSVTLTSSSRIWAKTISITLAKATEGSVAAAFEAALIDMTNAECAAQAVTSGNWANIKTVFTHVESDFASEAELVKDAEESVEAIRRYKVIIEKYGYEDFLSKGYVQLASRYAVEFNEANNNTMIIIVAIAAVSAISLAVLLVLKKKKHN